MAISAKSKILASDINTALSGKQDALGYIPVKSVNGVTVDDEGNVDIAQTVMPDYSAGVTLNKPNTTLQTYTAPANGVIVYDIMGFNNAYATLIINDVTIVNNASVTNSAYWNLNGALFVRQGDVVQYKHNGPNGKAGPSINFYPLRGV